MRAAGLHARPASSWYKKFHVPFPSRSMSVDVVKLIILFSYICRLFPFAPSSCWSWSLFLSFGLNFLSLLQLGSVVFDFLFHDRRQPFACLKIPGKTSHWTIIIPTDHPQQSSIREGRRTKHLTPRPTGLSPYHTTHTYLQHEDFDTILGTLCHCHPRRSRLPRAQCQCHQSQLRRRSVRILQLAVPEDLLGQTNGQLPGLRCVQRSASR